MDKTTVGPMTNIHIDQCQKSSLTYNKITVWVMIKGYRGRSGAPPQPPEIIPHDFSTPKNMDTALKWLCGGQYTLTQRLKVWVLQKKHFLEKDFSPLVVVCIQVTQHRLGMCCAMLIVACLSSQTWHIGGCHDSCDFTRWYGKKKANLPVLLCLESENVRYRAVYCCIEIQLNMQTIKSWQPW